MLVPAPYKSQERSSAWRESGAYGAILGGSAVVSPHKPSLAARGMEVPRQARSRRAASSGRHLLGNERP
jgi:hypothetical protein